MKKFSRCALIFIVVTLLGAIGAYIYESSTITSMYTSTAKVIVTPGEKNEATVRATDGGLVKDFEVVFRSNVVISAAQKTAGTSEDIAQYLTVTTVPNSNIIELTITNPDQTTAKTYVDAIAKSAVKTTSIVAVESMQVLEYGDESNVAVKPDLNRKAAVLTCIIAALCLVIELIVIFVMNAFREDDDSDDELEYERRFGQMMRAGYMLPYDKNSYEGAKAEEDDEEDEDEKFNKAIGADIYKEELAKLAANQEGAGSSEDPVKAEHKNKKKNEKQPEAAEAPKQEDVIEEADDDDVEEASNVVSFDRSQSSLSDSIDDYEDEPEEEDYDEYDDEYDDEDDDDDADSVASEAAVTMEPEKPAVTEAESDSFKSSSEVIGIIRK